MRKLVFGAGINDADYVVRPTVNGEQVFCPFYRTWQEMLRRCYSAMYQEKYPTYKGCTVCDEWLTFSTFKKWMAEQEWEGMCLDKDLLKYSNKVYSPETCLFVTNAINALLKTSGAARGIYPQGVGWKKTSGKLGAQISKHGKIVHLGLFDDVKLAADAYNNSKAKYIYEIAQEQIEPLRSALLRHSDIYALKSFGSVTGR